MIHLPRKQQLQMMESNRGRKLTAVLCQTSPQLKEKEKNIARFDKLLQDYTPADHIDIVVFPQMSFTGYNFKDAQDIMPMAVSYGQGAEFQYAAALARRINSYVLIGYVEKEEKEGKIELYNSAAVLDREGKPIFNTRKVHLYYAEELWGKEGDSFHSLDIVTCQGHKLRCSVGICMDINEKNFSSGKWQFGDHIKQEKAEVILFPTNWINSDPHDSQQAMETYNYWAYRLKPILKPKSTKNVLFLAADRVGSEYAYYNKQHGCFLGSSCAISFIPNVLIDMLDTKTESALKVTHRIQ